MGNAPEFAASLNSLQEDSFPVKAKSSCCFEASSEAYLPNRLAVVLPGDIKCAEVACGSCEKIERV